MDIHIQQQAPGSGIGASAAVIIDSGHDARVVVLELPVGAGVGLRFVHQGITWEITGRRPQLRTLVAEPVSH